MTQSGKLDQDVKDSLLLFEFCLKLQNHCSSPQKGLAEYHLNKTISLLLRHWEILQYYSFPSIHNWGIQHRPFRYGEIVIKRVCPEVFISRREYPVDFLLGILKLKIFRELGVRIEEDEYRIKGKERCFFSLPNLEYFGELLKCAEIETSDRLLIENLSYLYSQLVEPEYESLSTCPNEGSTFLAIKAQVEMWIHDTSLILNTMENWGKTKGFQSKASFDRNLDKAFTCGQQIGKKINWYTRVPDAKGKLLRIAEEIGIDDKVIEPIVSSVGDGRLSQRLIDAEETAKILTAYVGLLSNVLKYYQKAKGLTEIKLGIAEDFHHHLEKVGFTDYQYNNLMNYSLTGEQLPSIAKKFKNLHVKICAYLESNQLPGEFDLYELFS